LVATQLLQELQFAKVAGQKVQDQRTVFYTLVINELSQLYIITVGYRVVGMMLLDLKILMIIGG
jgi:hypothetical protein